MSDSTPPTPPPPPPGGGAPPPSGFGGAAGGPPPMGGSGVPGGSPPPAAGGVPYSPVDALKYGWERFTQNIGPWVLGALLYVGIIAVFMLVFGLLFGAVFAAAPPTVDPRTGEITSASTGFVAGVGLGTILLIAIALIIGWIVHAQISRAAYETADRGSIEFKVFTTTTLLGALIVAGLIAGVFSALGLLACCVGAIIIGFFVQYYAYPILDGSSTSGWEGVKRSFSFVSANLGPVLLYSLLVLAVGFVLGLVAGLFGILLPILGQILQFLISLVLIPVFAIGQAYTYRKLNGQQVAAENAA